MSWIDIYLSDGTPNNVYGADAQAALTSMLKIKDLPYIWMFYRKEGIALLDSFMFIVLDVVRAFSYKKGFKAGESYFAEECD